MYGGTKEEMARLIKDAAKMTDVQNELGVSVDENSMSFGNIVNAISVMQKSLDIAGTTSKEASTTISGSISSMKSSWENLVAGFGNEDADLSGLIDNFTNSFMTVVDNVVPRIEVILGGIADALPQLVGKISEKLPEVMNRLLPPLIQGATSLITGLVAALPTIIQILIEQVPFIVTEIGKALVQTAPVLLDAAKNLGSQIMGAIGSSVSEYDGAFSGVVESFENIKNVLSDVFNNSIKPLFNDFIKIAKELWTENKDKLNKIAELFSLVFEKIGDAVKWLVGIIRDNMDNIKKTFQSGIDFISNIVDFFIAVFKGDWQGMWDAVKRILKSGFDFVKNIFNLIKSVISSISSSIKKVVKEAFSNVKNVISEKLGEAKEKVKEIFTQVKNNIVNTLKGVITNVKTIGSDIVKGLWNGINDKVSWVVDKVKGFGEDVLSGIKDFFGIHSPSRVMRDEVGAQLAAGVAEGIKKNTKLAKASAEKMSQAVLDAAEKKLDKYKTYNNMTLAEEVRFWNDIRKQCKKGTDARLQADKNYLSAKKSLNEQLLQAENDYKQKAEEINKKLKEDIQSVNDAYSDAVDQRKSKILSAFSLFDSFTSGDAIDSSTLVTGLQTQVDALNDWKANITLLKDRIGNTDLFQTIQEMGVSALSQVKAINSMTQEELNTYTALYAERQKSADEQAQTELQTLKEETLKKVEELNAEAEKQLENNKKTWIETCNSLGVTVKESMTKTSSTAKKNLEKISTSATTNMNKAAKAVENGVKKMQKAMDFEWELPYLKMPHFSISGSFSLNPPSVPTFGVEWYKNGGIMTKPTAFGINPASGKVMAGGEAGDEAIAPVDLLKQYVADAVSEKNKRLEQLMETQNELLASILAKDSNTYLDGEKISSNVNKRLGFAL